MKKEAILESKCILDQTEGSMVNYGGAYSNFAIAEKSGSFLDKKKRYVFVFKINNSKKEFDVNEMIYNKYDEQSLGILEYSGKNFIDFSEIKNSNAACALKLTVAPIQYQLLVTISYDLLHLGISVPRCFYGVPSGARF